MIRNVVLIVAVAVGGSLTATLGAQQPGNEYGRNFYNPFTGAGATPGTAYNPLTGTYYYRGGVAFNPYTGRYPQGMKVYNFFTTHTREE
jgi:hypothetical protein